MQLRQGIATWSPSDLSAASECEFGFLRNIDVKAGRIDDPGFQRDPMLQRAATLGDAHEQRILDGYRAEFADGVAIIDRPANTPEAVAEAVENTQTALEAGRDVVFQAAFSDTDAGAGIAFIGYADFITRQPNGAYRVEDSKLARHARVTALLQMAAYAEQIAKLGVEVDDTVTLILGDGSRSDHKLTDVAPGFRVRRARLVGLITERQAEGTANGAHVEWGDNRYAICGQCDWCKFEIEQTDDVLAVAGLKVTQRTRLRSAGIQTINELATSTGGVTGIGNSTLANLRLQAQLQATRAAAEAPPVALIDASALSALPPPSPGDMFFDFEGDPLYEEDGDWGIDYLWGWCDETEAFTPIWAHSHAEEADALREFLDTVAQRRAEFPDMHVYHYAPYEKTHLLSAAVRHGLGVDEVDDLLRQHVLVDLYPIVKRTMRIGSASYSIKKLEPLYFNRKREGVDNAGDSIDVYSQACTLRDSGDNEGWHAMLDAIASYNDDDVASTRQLRDWLLGFQERKGVSFAAPAVVDAPEEVTATPQSAAADTALELRARADAARTRGDEESALLADMARAATTFHKYEQKVFWQGHYSRLVQPIEEWADERDVFVVDSAKVLTDWSKPPRAKKLQRVLRLDGRAAPGSRWPEGATPFVLYDAPGPFAVPNAEPGSRPHHNRASVVEGDSDRVELRERLVDGVGEYADLPRALAPSSPPDAAVLAAQIESWALKVTSVPAETVSDACVDVLLRRPPRMKSGSLAPADPEDATPAVVDSMLRVDRSYLAIQGPPGTGKTHVGSHVVADLVRNHGWRIGVVGQSHRVVENFLNAVVDKAELDPTLAGKAPKQGDKDLAARASFQVLAANAVDSFTSQSGTGWVIGGTAWTFAKLAGQLDRPLDLLVIDEAGQFSLPMTIASAASASRILLLGDPQQLPQVTQARHEDNIDTSALGWLSKGHDVLPGDLSYFLALTRRMHPELTEPVSQLAYEGSLASHASTSQRRLADVMPGLCPRPIAHTGNSVESAEEAGEVLAIVQEVLGKPWTDPAKNRTEQPLAEDDILVITPYNGQVNTVSDVLANAGFPNIRVGTVDKFQGQEAPVCIVTMAASSAREVPRGTEFLLNRNRLNVAISRGQWVTYLVHSPGLTDFMPRTPERLAELSRFAGLTLRGSN